MAILVVCLLPSNSLSCVLEGWTWIFAPGTPTYTHVCSPWSSPSKGTGQTISDQDTFSKQKRNEQQ